MFYLWFIFFIGVLTTRISEGNMPKVPNLNDFLQKIQTIESSNGRNTNHPMVQNGIQAGDQAIGRYGLMPNTVRELVNRRRADQTSTSELEDLAKMPSDQMKQYIEQNPGLEDSLAKQMATMVTRKEGGDEDRSAYAWTNGHNLAPDQISDDQLDTSPYVQKYRKLQNMMDEE